MRKIIKQALIAGIDPHEIIAELKNFAENNSIQFSDNAIGFDLYFSRSVKSGFFSDKFVYNCFIIDHKKKLWYENGKTIQR